MPQLRLAFGLRVNSPLDNSTNYFAASAARNLAADLTRRKEDIGQASSAITAANAGLTAIGQLLDSAKAIADTAATTGSMAECDNYATSRQQLFCLLGRGEERK